MQPGSQDIVQMFLLSAVVLTLPRHPHAEYITVELQTAVGIAHDNRRVINTEEHSVTWAMPFLQALVRRKLKSFQRVTVRIFEIESPDAGRVLIPLRKALRSRGYVFHFVLTQPSICLIHVVDDDGYVLEGTIVAVGVHGDRPAFRGEILGQLNIFVPEAHPD